LRRCGGRTGYRRVRGRGRRGLERRIGRFSLALEARWDLYTIKSDALILCFLKLRFQDLNLVVTVIVVGSAYVVVYRGMVDLVHKREGSTFIGCLNNFHDVDLHMGKWVALRGDGGFLSGILGVPKIEAFP
jgi:hypothetical protein